MPGFPHYFWSVFFSRVAGAGNAFFRPPFFGFTSFLFKKNQEGSKNNQSLYRAKMNGQKSVCEQSVNLRALRNVFPSSFGFPSNRHLPMGSGTVVSLLRLTPRTSTVPLLRFFRLSSTRSPSSSTVSSPLLLLHHPRLPQTLSTRYFIKWTLQLSVFIPSHRLETSVRIKILRLVSQLSGKQI